MIRFAVVGAGWIAQEAFMPSVQQAGNARMTALVSGNSAGARQLADFYGIEHVTSYEGYDDLLRSDVIDAVYIALPNSMHADFAIRAARAGKHVMVEKPLAISIEECDAMIITAKENGVFLMTAYRLHNEPGTVAAIEAVHSGKIGEPRFFSSVFSFQMKAGNHRLKSDHWGGPLQDVGVYCLNMARHVFGEEPIEAFAMTSRPRQDARFAEIDDGVAVTLRFPGERLAQFYCSFGASALDQFLVVGSQGQISMDPAYRFETATHMKLKDENGVEDHPFPQIDHFAAQIAYFSDCIAAGTPPEADGEEGMADMLALLAIEQSIKTGLPQPISSPPRSRHPSADMVRITPITNRRLLL